MRLRISLKSHRPSKSCCKKGEATGMPLKHSRVLIEKVLSEYVPLLLQWQLRGCQELASAPAALPGGHCEHRRGFDPKSLVELIVIAEYQTIRNLLGGRTLLGLPL